MENFAELRSRAELLAAGFTDAEVRRRLRTRALTSVCRGSYVRADDARLRDVEARHVLAVRAVLPRVAAGSVASHVSAALVHRLPVWAVPLNLVHLTRDGRAGGRVTAVRHAHVAPLECAEIVEVGGIPVTSLARTVVDLARSVPFEQAVVVADGALAAGLELASLVAAAERASRWPGGPAARRVVDFADGRAGSAGESRSRVALQRAGLPVPELQWEVRASDGRFLGRTDFAWPQMRTVGEFDGRAKYGRRLLRPGQTSGDVVFAEKLREDALRAEHLGVVRWIWSDLDEFDRVAVRLWRTFRR